LATGDVTAALRERSTEVAHRWRAALVDVLDLERDAVLPPGDANRIARLVAHVLEAEEAPLLPQGAMLPADVRETLREYARLRIAQLYGLDQVLSELALLQDLWFEALHEESPVGVRAADLVTTAAQVASGTQRLTAALAALWQDEIDARRASEDSDLFVRALGHEVQDPLNAAIVAAEVLAEDDGALDPARRRAMLQTVPRNLRRTCDLIGAIRLLARPDEDEDGRRRLRPLDTLVDQVLDDLRPLADHHQVLLAVDGALPGASVDGLRLHLVLRNLLDNAIRYSDGRKSSRWVRVTARTDGGRCRIEVADNGMGIPEAEQDRVFDRAYRVQRSEGAAVAGKGLGLAIVREALRQMGGRIQLDSRDGIGSTFTLAVPLLDEPASGRRARTDAADGVQSPSHGGLTAG